jgi:hypothetical protein
MRLLRIERLDGPLERMCHQIANRRRLEHRWLRQDDVAGHLPAPRQQLARIRQPDRLKEEEADPAWVQGDGEDDLRHSLGRTKADGQGIVVNVDNFDRSRQPSAHLSQDRVCLIGDLR